MRILMVTDTYAPARNGVAMWLKGTVRDLRAAGHEVEILTFRHDLREPGQPGVFELPAYFWIDRDLKFSPIVSGLPPEMSEMRWDIVHSHHPVLLGPPGIDLGRRCGARIVFTCHSVYTDYLDEYAAGVGGFLKPALERRVARYVNRCDRVLTPSTEVGRWLARIGVTTPAEMFEAPADTERVHPRARADARAALGLADERVALFVGRITEEKRTELLVREFAIAAARVPSAVLALAGSGAREGAVRRLAERLGIGDRVRLLGDQTGEALGTWYSAADCNVSASRTETGPLTVVEAMACGTPTVGYRAPGFEDRVVDGVNGLLAVQAPGELGAAMATVLGDEALRERLAQGALARAGRYTNAAITERLVSVYEGLL